MVETTFREGMRGVVHEILGAATVGKWIYFDANGEVYGHSSPIEVDVAIKNGAHVLIEVKPSISRGDIAEFWRIGKLYKRVNGVKPRLIVILPYVDEKAAELAKNLGMEVYVIV
jgi:hypothetical protein